MAEAVATLVVRGLYAYTVTGVLFALFFVAFGLAAVDSQARGTSLGFRLLIFPGVAAFWPLLLKRWLRGDLPEEGNPHQ